MPATKRKPAVKHKARKAPFILDAQSRVANRNLETIGNVMVKIGPEAWNKMMATSEFYRGKIAEQDAEDAVTTLLDHARYRFREAAAQAHHAVAPTAPIHIGISGLTSDIVARLHHLLDKEGDLQQIEALVERVTGLNPPPTAIKLNDDPMPEAVSARLHAISDLLQRVENRLGGLMHNLGEAL